MTISARLGEGIRAVLGHMGLAIQGEGYFMYQQLFWKALSGGYVSIEGALDEVLNQIGVDDCERVRLKRLFEEGSGMRPRIRFVDKTASR